MESLFKFASKPCMMVKYGAKYLGELSNGNSVYLYENELTIGTSEIYVRVPLSELKDLLKDG